jgi:hypothetical protein
LPKYLQTLGLLEMPAWTTLPFCRKKRAGSGRDNNKSEQQNAGLKSGAYTIVSRRENNRGRQERGAGVDAA